MKDAEESPEASTVAMVWMGVIAALTIGVAVYAFKKLTSKEG